MSGVHRFGCWLIACALALTACSSASNGATSQSTASPAKTASQSPSVLSNTAFSARALNGSAVTTASLKGHRVLLVSWATWCGECRTEMPQAQAFATKHAAEGLKVVAVNVNEDNSTYLIKKSAFEWGLTMPIWLDQSRQFARTYHAFGVPTTVLLDKEGHAVHVWPGAVDFTDASITSTIVGH